jgi:hypothetical protein
MAFLSLRPYVKVGDTLNKPLVTTQKTYKTGTKVTQGMVNDTKKTIIRLHVIDNPTVTRNLTKNKIQTYNQGGKSTFVYYNSGDAGTTFKVKCLIRKSDTLSDGRTVFTYLNQLYANHFLVSVVMRTEVVPNGVYVISDFTEYEPIRKDYYECEIEFTKYTKVSAKLTNKCTILQSHLKECKRPKVKVYTTKQINAAKKGKPLTKKVKGKDGKTKTITINPKPSTCVKYVNQMLYKKGYLSKKTYKNYGSYWTKYSRRALKKYQKKWNKKGLRPKINEKGTISKNCWKAIKRYTEVK